MKLLHALTQYGLDSLYSKLNWHDKVQILDIANRTEAPYVKKAFNRVVIDILLVPYETLIQEVTTETLIQIAAHLQAYSGATTMRVELWQKIQLCLIESLKIRLGEYELEEKLENISKQSLQILTAALCAQSFG